MPDVAIASITLPVLTLSRTAIAAAGIAPVSAIEGDLPFEICGHSIGLGAALQWAAIPVLLARPVGRPAGAGRGASGGSRPGPVAKRRTPSRRRGTAADAPQR